jgi:hypothetical protein
MSDKPVTNPQPQSPQPNPRPEQPPAMPLSTEIKSDPRFGSPDQPIKIEKRD